MCDTGVQRGHIQGGPLSGSRAGHTQEPTGKPFGYGQENRQQCCTPVLARNYGKPQGGLNQPRSAFPRTAGETRFSPVIDNFARKLRVLPTPVLHSNTQCILHPVANTPGSTLGGKHPDA